MKTSELLQADYRVEENRKVIQRVLMQIIPLSKRQDSQQVQIVDMEKLLRYICKKYDADVLSIRVNYRADGDLLYTADVSSDDRGHIKYIYGITLYEVVAKSLILLYALVKQGKVRERKNAH